MTPAALVTAIDFEFRDEAHGFVLSRRDCVGCRPRLEETFDGGATWRVVPGVRIPVRRELAAFARAVPRDARQRIEVLRPWDRGSGIEPGDIVVTDETVVTRRIAWASISERDTTPSALAVSADGGKSWRRLSHPCPSRFRFTTYIVVASGTQAWLICEGPQRVDGAPKAVFRTRDGGRTWRAGARAEPPRRRATRGGLPYAALITGVDLDASRFGVMTMLHDHGRARPPFVTRDGGSSWVPLAIAQPRYADAFEVGVASERSAFLLVGYGSYSKRRYGLLATRDRARTWRLLRSWAAKPPS